MRLKVVSGNVLGKTFEIREGEWVIGRDGADIDLRDHWTGDKHAKLIVTATKIDILDLGAPSGVFVNGKKVSKCVVAEGDNIRLGRSVLRIEPRIDLPDTSEERLEQALRGFREK